MVPIGYSFLQAVHPSHGPIGVDYSKNEVIRWICGNRDFYTGARSLEGHAKRQWHTIFSHGYKAWEQEYMSTDRLLFDLVWNRFIQMAKSNMRLMCLDKGPKYRIGWAATAARLRNDVFFLPGCDVPVILRRMEDGQYRLVGDAIVPGAMATEIWGQARPQDMQQVGIVW
ncbi:hypothetical protein M3J09_002843 [Ascochyta lentis]